MILVGNKKKNIQSVPNSTSACQARKGINSTTVQFDNIIFCCAACAKPISYHLFVMCMFTILGHVLYIAPQRRRSIYLKNSSEEFSTTDIKKYSNSDVFLNRLNWFNMTCYQIIKVYRVSHESNNQFHLLSKNYIGTPI